MPVIVSQAERLDVCIATLAGSGSRPAGRPGWTNLSQCLFAVKNRFFRLYDLSPTTSSFSVMCGAMVVRAGADKAPSSLCDATRLNGY